MPTPIGRTTRMSLYSPGNERPQVLHGTWLEAESFAYPAGGFTRRAYVELVRNTHNPVELPYGRCYVVKCSIPDTYFTIPARLRVKGRTVKGYISQAETVGLQGQPAERFTFTPEGAISLPV
jgi:hypothetical protein